MDFLTDWGVIIALVCAGAAVLYGVVTSRWLLALSPGNQEMQEISTAVQEADLRAATLALTSTGLYVEPTSAQVLPALEQFRREGHVTTNDTVVLILTGSGLKAGDAMARLLAD